MCRLLGIGVCVVLAAAGGCGGAAPPPTQVADFTLTERSGQPLRRDDLSGKVWIAAFVFTRCAGPCSQVSGTMARLQHELADLDDVRLVTFTVDPDHDTPEVLKKYADTFAARPERWLFVTGDKQALYSLIQGSFLLGVQENTGAARTPGNEVTHSTRLVVVDRQGRIRHYFDGTQADDVPRLKAAVAALIQERP